MMQSRYHCFVDHAMIKPSWRTFKSETPSSFKFYFVPYLPPSDGWFTVLHDPAQPTFDIRSNELVCISKLTHSSFGIYFTRVHRWQHPHRKHWPPQSQAGHTSLGSFPKILCIFSSFPKILCIFSSFPLCNTIIL